jgi:hypothetical protein
LIDFEISMSVKHIILLFENLISRNTTIYCPLPSAYFHPGITVGGGVSVGGAAVPVSVTVGASVVAGSVVAVAVGGTGVLVGASVVATVTRVGVNVGGNGVLVWVAVGGGGGVSVAGWAMFTNTRYSEE